MLVSKRMGLLVMLQAEIADCVTPASAVLAAHLGRLDTTFAATLYRLGRNSTAANPNSCEGSSKRSESCVLLASALRPLPVILTARLLG